MKIKTVPSGSRIYNVCDKAGHGRGMRIENGKLVRDRSFSRIYSLIRHDGEYGVCESYDVFGNRFEERIHLSELEEAKQQQYKSL